MIRLFFTILLWAGLTNALAQTCEIRGKVGAIEVRECDDEAGTFLVALNSKGHAISQIKYEETLTGIDTFWASPCACYLLQVTGIGGAHTRIARLFRIKSDGGISEIPNGIFGSEIGSISRVVDGPNLYFVVRDSVQGKSYNERYKFDGTRILRIK